MSQLAAERYRSGAAIVAGGSGGIGAAICSKLAAGGANVALTYRRGRDRAEVTAERIRSLGRQAHIYQLDLGDAAAVSSVIEQVAKDFGGVHTAVCAAGPMLKMRFISAIDPEVFRETVGADLFGCYNLLQASIPYLRAMRGAIVALGTSAVRRIAPKDILSAAPKAAIESLIRGLASEEGRFGVRANQVGVGVITDGMYDGLKSQGDFTNEWLEKSRQILALKRFGTAENIADAVEFLASDRASFITGQVLMVDGGYAL